MFSGYSRNAYEEKKMKNCWWWWWLGMGRISHLRIKLRLSGFLRMQRKIKRENEVKERECIEMMTKQTHKVECTVRWIYVIQSPVYIWVRVSTHEKKRKWGYLHFENFFFAGSNECIDFSLPIYFFSLCICM